MKVRIAVVAMVVLSCLSGCVKQPEFIDVQNIRVVGLRDSTVSVSLVYTAYNQNRISTRLVESQVDLYYDGKLVGTGSLDSVISLPKSDTIHVPMTCQINLKSLGKYFPTILKQETSQFSFRGYGKAKAWFGAASMKFNDQVSIDVRSTVRKEINRLVSDRDNFNIKKFDFHLGSGGGANAKVLVEWKNTLPFAYQIVQQKFDVGFKGNSKSASTYESDTLMQVNEGQRFTIPLQINFNNLDQLIGSGISFLFSGKVDMWIDGNVTLRVADETFELPVNANKSIRIGSLTN